MATKAIFKGVLHVGKLVLPVKFYSAIEDRSIRFHLLHDQDKQRVEQKMVNSVTGKESAAVKKGFEMEEGTFVILTEEEIESVAPADSRDIHVERFVPARAIGRQWLDRPYYLGPDNGSRDNYFALAKALGAREKVGIARWVMRDKEYVGALEADRGYLILQSMRFADEVVDAADLNPPEGPALDKREVQLAEQLVKALAGKFEAEKYHDEHRKRLEELIEKKARGKRIPARKPVRLKTAERSLAAALEASLGRASRN